MVIGLRIPASTGQRNQEQIRRNIERGPAPAATGRASGRCCPRRLRPRGEPVAGNPSRVVRKMHEQGLVFTAD